MLRNLAPIVQFWFVEWDEAFARQLGVKKGVSSSQYIWESTALFLCLVSLGDTFTEGSLQVVGDYVGALSNALNLKGSGQLLAIARELAWRRARRSA